MKKILSVIIMAIVIWILIFPFVIYYDYDVMVVSSDSMIPTLKPNDLLIVQDARIDKIVVNDIIVFDSHVEGIGVVAHRAIEKFYDNGKIAIRTQGDNVVEADTWIVHDEDLIGKVIGNISFIGILLIEPVRYALLIVIVVMGISLLRDIISQTKLQKSK